MFAILLFQLLNICELSPNKVYHGMLMAVCISFRRTKNHRRSKRNPQSRKMHSRHSKEISKRYETADFIKKRDYDECLYV